MQTLAIFYVIHVVLVLIISILSKKCTLCYNTHDICITPTCFGTEMPSSGNFYNKGVQAKLPIMYFNNEMF